MFSLETNIFIILICSLAGLVWAIVNTLLVAKVHLTGKQTKGGYDQFDQENQNNPRLQLVLEIASYIERGAKSFLFQEYKYIGVFVTLMSLIIFFLVEEKLGQFWTTLAFIIGCLTSLLSGYIGMRIAVFSNYRTAFQAQESMSKAFHVAFRGGCVMGFALTSLGLFVLALLIILYTNLFVVDYEDFTKMFECIAGYGLGGSTIALFGRVGGGIFTKAADVGADLVGKVEEGMQEDSPNNPATIADNVGDNVGDIAGMGSDLFGSFAEATSAALVVASASPTFYYQPSALMYPLMISAFGIIVCIFTSLIANVSSAKNYKSVSSILKNQLVISTVLAVPALFLAGYITLPDRLYGLGPVDRTPLHAWFCTLFGLWSGLIIGLVTEYYTSHSFTPVREVARACETGAATNVIYGLALGQISTIIPVILLSITAFACHTFLGMFGIALGALGMLSTLAIGLAIDGYGPISDNAGGIAEMADLGKAVRDTTDALDAAGNTTAAIGKGFAIGSAALVSLSLYGAFLTKAANFDNKHTLAIVEVNAPLVFSGLLIGAMLPYAFSALTMKSVGKAAFEMVEEVRRQLRVNPEIKTGRVRPDYERCIAIATKSSLSEMFLPAFIVLGVPFIIGILFGPIGIAGLLPGILVSGVSMAISSANSGGAWDNAKKYIESGEYVNKLNQRRGKGSEEHRAAVIGDTIGDPLKDTSGPAINILIKLSAIFSLIFIQFFDKTAYLQCIVAPTSPGCLVVEQIHYPHISNHL